MYSSKSCKSSLVIVLLIVGTASYAAFRPHHTSVPLLGVANTALLGISTPMVTCPHAPDIAHEPPPYPNNTPYSGEDDYYAQLTKLQDENDRPLFKSLSIELCCPACRAKDATATQCVHRIDMLPGNKLHTP